MKDTGRQSASNEVGERNLRRGMRASLVSACRSRMIEGPWNPNPEEPARVKDFREYLVSTCS